MKTAQLPPSQTSRQVVRRNRQREQTDGSRRPASTTLETVLFLLLIYWSGAMSSGMTGQTPCLSSRWDKTAQPKQSVDVRQQRSSENAAHSVSLSGVVSNAGSNSTVSQPPQTGEKPAPQGGVEMAAAMAAKINAMLMAKGKLLTPPPLLAKTPPSVSVPTTTEEMVVTEVDINDVPLTCRDLLTKGKTQEEIRQFSGAIVSTKGHYMSDAEKGKAGQRPLYLHVHGKNHGQVNKAVLRIKEIISEDLLRASAASGQQMPVMPPLTLYPQPPRPVITPPVPRMPNTTSVPGHRPAAPHSGSFVHTKIFVGLDQALPSFNVNEKVEGPGGSYLSHIQAETGARVFLRGKGSGYIEQASKRESFEPLYVYISHPNAAGLESAKKLTESLLETVRDENARMASMYTTTGSTQPYAAHGFPPNSNYSSQGSWYNYPANGYAGGYSAYSGASGYWSNANGPPSHSNMSTNPPSSQAMVQYPVCPRKPHPYLSQHPGSSETVAPEGSLSTPPDPGSPRRHFQEGSREEQPTSKSPEGPAHQESALPASSVGEEKVVERILMPPPPPLFVAPAPVARKRPRDTVAEDPVSLPGIAASMAGVQEELCEKKSKVDESGLVPYEGDSSDEEEERTHSSKTDNS
ncbi:KH homology domain-containing protein 4-like isoform X1 [Sander lucioperca]|uniref:KH homology domain-containing protein 4-like isoform X1 n=1 Tax=Sander lucioperca TaxID=283035 RepID=UPI00165384F2|nr:KH homology domain-containing protein 4-like isoform X1 [Sander lucioperca]